MTAHNRVVFPIAALAAAFLLYVPPVSADEGKKAFKKNRCLQCHTVVAGKHKIGPSLHGIIGRKAASADGFKASRYSKLLKAASEKGLVWDEANLDAFLTKPKKWLQEYTGMKGNTKMAYPGLKKADQRKLIIEYIKAAK